MGIVGKTHQNFSVAELRKDVARERRDAVDEAAQDFSCGLENTGNNNRGDDDGNGGWIRLMSNRSICGL